MLEVLLKRFRRLHMIGIGGSGMSGIAEVLLLSGFRVTGSDQAASEVLGHLRSLGAEITVGHEVSSLRDAEVVVYSNAIRDDNPELMEARRRGIPLIPRAEMLAELMRMKAGVAVAGTHGKTTTTSLVGEVLAAAGLDPTVIVGGRLRQVKGNVRHGTGQMLVVEADEFEKSFLKLSPTLVVVTNIDGDHLECYGSFAGLKDAFVSFADSIPFYGRAVVCSDDPVVREVMPRLGRPVVTYGTTQQAMVRGEGIRFEGMQSSFTLSAGGKRLGDIRLPIPGRHNVLNALAAAAIGLELEADFESIRSALESFEGVHRRFEIVGDKSGILVVDDFGHHPAEITATLSAARAGWRRRLVVVFQPHLFSRTQMLADDFGRALMGADIAFVLPIYPAREAPIEGVTSDLIVDAARRFGHTAVVGLPSRDVVAEEVRKVVKPGDLVLTVGAGDVSKLAPMIIEALD